MKKAITFYFISICSFLILQQVSAQTSGQYDQGFALNGQLSDANISPFKYSSMALVPGNEFVISRVSNDTLTVIRFLVNGSRDVTFGPSSNGLVNIVLPWSNAYVLSSAVQSDRKTLLAGTTDAVNAGGKGFILRLNDDGSVDNSFGSNGYVYQQLYPFSGEKIWQVTVQPDGNILALDVAITSGSTDTVSLLRYTINGTLDHNFDNTGILNIPFYQFLPTGPFTFKVDANNLINFGAYSNYADTDNLYLFQLNPDGLLNTNYAQGPGQILVAGGSLMPSPRLINRGFSLGLNFQADDKLILTQSSLVDSVQWIVERFNTDGTPDVAFGDSGIVTMQGGDGGVPFDIHSIEPTPFSQIVIAGLVSLAGSTRIDITRLNANGSIDGAFGSYQGHAILNCAEVDDIVNNLIIQPDEKILINGLVAEKGYKFYEVVRLIGSGTGGNSTGITEASTSYSMEVYPNPAGNSLYVSIPGINDGNIELADMQGRIVAKQVIMDNSPHHLQIDGVANGMYLLTVKNGDTVLTQRVAKQ